MLGAGFERKFLSIMGMISFHSPQCKVRRRYYNPKWGPLALPAALREAQ